MGAQPQNPLRPLGLLVALLALLARVVRLPSPRREGGLAMPAGIFQLQASSQMGVD